MDEQDIEHLNRALDLAEKGRGCTSPNPVVGAVIVREGKTLGEGWHAGAGLDHAEVAAIRDALARAGAAGDSLEAIDWGTVKTVCSRATVYVSLEPCCTQGRTPPCTTALISGGFARVVVGALDPTPAVNGRGVRALREAGLQVEVAEGGVNRRARRQNDGLRKSVAQSLPFVTYKYAMTLDGRVCTDSGDSRWVSSAESRAMVHWWRGWSDAVVVGAGTLRVDDPTLTSRGVGCARQPLRVVVDSDCSVAESANLVRSVDDGPVLILCAEDVSRSRLEEVEKWGVSAQVVPRSAGQALDPMAVCKLLAVRGVQSVLLEGGPRLAGSWWNAGLVDKVAAFVSPKVVSGEMARGPFCGSGAHTMQEAVSLQEVEVAQIGPDVLITGYTGGPF